MQDTILNLRLFCSNLQINIDAGTPVQGGVQYKLEKNGQIVFITLYNSGTCTPRGALSELMTLCRVWCDRSYTEGMLHPDFAASWREWNTNAKFIADFHALNGVPDEATLTEDYRLNRELLFHDYMFCQKRSNLITYDAITYVVSNWLRRYCFMNISPNQVLDVAFRYIQDNPPLGQEGGKIPFGYSAEALSVSLVGFCATKSLVCPGELCPFSQHNLYDCICELIDMMFVYCDGAQVISYNKTNLGKLLKGKRDVSWTSTVPGSPLEETFRQALFDAGLLNYPQYQALAPIRRYRVDYMIPTPNGGMLAVECDGLQYHAKPTAYAKDRQRDNLFLQQGITPVRFCTTDIMIIWMNVFKQLKLCSETIRPEGRFIIEIAELVTLTPHNKLCCRATK